MAAETGNGENTASSPAAFAAQGYVAASGLIDAPLTDFLWQYARMRTAYGHFKPDAFVPGAMVRYGDPTFETLLETLRPRIEALTGLSLHPTYSFFRMYRRGDVLTRHRDRPACEISVSLNLGQRPADPWPLWVAGAQGDAAIALSPGDALIYRGVERYHWRNAYAGEQLAQLFLHYVDRNGPHAERKFDGRAALMDRPVSGGHKPAES